MKPGEGTTFKFYQEQDSCAEGEDVQSLEVTICDAGGGKYLTLSTSRWALDLEDLGEFVKALKKCLRECE